MSNLSFYDVDKNYINYLKNVEISNRGFTCIPDMIYNGEQKFLPSLGENVLKSDDI